VGTAKNATIQKSDGSETIHSWSRLWFITGTSENFDIFFVLRRRIDQSGISGVELLEHKGVVGVPPESHGVAPSYLFLVELKTHMRHIGDNTVGSDLNPVFGMAPLINDIFNNATE
jgi:hypothetical protein